MCNLFYSGGDFIDDISVHLVQRLPRQSALCVGNVLVEHTIFSRPNSSLPLSVSDMGVTLNSHPLSLRSTLAPNARPMIWCPKHTPIRRTLFCARTVLVNSTSLIIHGALSKEVCSTRQESLSSAFQHKSVLCFCLSWPCLFGTFPPSPFIERSPCLFDLPMSDFLRMSFDTYYFR